jgi:NADPH:quinone reductase-like Zn-dependent oxidoreductase
LALLETTTDTTLAVVQDRYGSPDTFALQLARIRQLRVTAVVSPRNAEQAVRLGADTVIDYTTSDFTRDGKRYDVVIDLVGNRRLRDLHRVLRPGGALVISGGGVSGQGRIVGPLGLLLRARLYRRTADLRILTPLAKPGPEVLDRLTGLSRTGRLTPIIDARYPLDAAAAIRHMETTHTTGKIITTVP